MNLHKAALTDTEFSWRPEEENQAISNLMLIQSCSLQLTQKCNSMKKQTDFLLTFLKDFRFTFNASDYSEVAAQIVKLAMNSKH